MALVVIAQELLGRVLRPRQLRRRERFGVRRRERVGVRRRERARGRRRVLSRPRLKLLVGLAALVIVLGGGWLWLRDSSLFAVKHVSVTGESGSDGARIRLALMAAARNMTTLHVRMDQLRMAVSPYPAVKNLRVSTQFPHGMRIQVVELNPVAGVLVDGRTIAVASDGTLLHDVSASGSVPTIPMRVPPGGARLTDRDALHAVALLAAAPPQLLSRIAQVTSVAAHGLVAQLRNGPSVYFGDATRLRAKWTAATAVLADSGSAGAVYIDVTDPGRPAAGAGSSGAATSGVSRPSAGVSSAASSSASSRASGSGWSPSSSTANASP